jgi:small multidrug resistance pump
MAWVFLAAAVVLEVVGTLALRVAASGRRRWYVVVAVAYSGAFAALTATLASGVPLGVAYGTWAAVGVALTAIASRVLYREALTPVMGLGIALIAAGVLLIEVGSTH